MRRALLRSWEAVAPSSLDAARVPGAGTVALRCTLAGCESCARFETEDRADFEQGLYRGGVSDIVEWDCGSSRHRELAIQAGVDELPAYVLLGPPPQAVRVVRPP